MSEALIERSSKALEAFETRSLEDLDVVAIIVDAKHVAGKQMVIALGVTLGGRKIPLGFAEASTEHHDPESFRDSGTSGKTSSAISRNQSGRHGVESSGVPTKSRLTWRQKRHSESSTRSFNR